VDFVNFVDFDFSTDRLISITSFRSVEVDFVADDGFRLIDTGFRKFWWISWI